MLEIGFVFTGINRAYLSLEKASHGDFRKNSSANLGNVPIFMKIFRLLWVERRRYLIVIFSAGDGIDSFLKVSTRQFFRMGYI